MQADNIKKSIGEFVALVAMMSGLNALSLDAMLPALQVIGSDLGVSEPNDRQLIIGLMFLGMSFGPVIFGPLSDSIGRKRAIYSGLLLYIIGTTVCLMTHSFGLMLIGRVLQGTGTSGPRVVAIAMVRDRFHGEGMARIMSFVMAVFIMVPALAPSVGQLIIEYGHWRHIFILFLVLGSGTLAWFALRQEETLADENRRPYSLEKLRESVWMVLTNRPALFFTLSLGFLFGGFLGYLSSAQQVFQEVYHTGSRFPFFFALLALSFGGASFFNARLVTRYGMWPMARAAIILHLINSTILAVVAVLADGVPGFTFFMISCSISFMGVGVSYSNLNAMAMQPLGRVAGMGAAVIAALSTLVSLPLGITMGRLYNQTVIPLAAGFALLALFAGLLMLLGQRYNSGQEDL